MATPRAKAPAKIKKYVAGGLVPQGGIVIGLALLVQQNPVFSSFSHILLNIVIGWNRLLIQI